MQQSPCREVTSSSPSQEMPRILWNSNVHHRIHKSLPPVPVLCQIGLIHPPPPLIPLLEDRTIKNTSTIIVENLKC